MYGVSLSVKCVVCVCVYVCVSDDVRCCLLAHIAIHFVHARGQDHDAHVLVT